MAIVAATLARIKSDPLACLGGAERINDFFARAGHAWRSCPLDPATTLKLFVLQVLNGNAALTHLRHLAGRAVCPSSYCEARQRLPVAAVAGFVERACAGAGGGGGGGGGGGDRADADEAAGSWRGHRVFVADATSASTPDEPVLQDLWPQPAAQRPGCGFPAIKLLGRLDLVTGMIVHLTLMSATVHEMSQLPAVHAALRAGDVLLADRGFCSFWHLAMLARSSVFALFRMHQRQVVDFTPGRPHRVHGNAKRSKGGERSERGERSTRAGRRRRRRGVPTSRYVRRLGHEDQLVEWARPANRPRWMSAADHASMPAALLGRELRYHVVARGRRTRVVTIATTLLDPTRYPKREVARLYGLRWEVETNFRHLKTTLSMEQLKCRSADGVIRELMIVVLVYNLVRAAMVRAAARQRAAPNRVSFVDALRRLRARCGEPAMAGEIDLIVNPVRPGRWHPRVLKRRIKPYDLLNRPRCEYPEPSTLEGVSG
jgi:hypothetical protein